MFNFLKRRSLSYFIINPKFQWGFIGRVCLLAAINFVIILAAVQSTFYAFYQRGTELQMPANSAYFRFITIQHNTMNYVFLGVGLANVLVLVLGGIVLSHRVAGPLYRLNVHMKEIAEGKTQGKVKFRNKDFFLELADSFNEQLAYLQKEQKKPAVEQRKKEAA